MIDAFFVAGTDTDVGKTVSSKAILDALNIKGLNTAAYKPVAAGSEDKGEGVQNSDAIHLRSAANVELSYEEVNPYALLLPASPHIAAEAENVVIDYSVLSQGLAALKAKSDVVLVEGAGGWRVPVSKDDCLSTWVKQEKLPVVLVVGIKLGCLSHAMLTAEAIQHDGLEIIGWVANRINPGTENYAEIIAMLEDKMPAPKLGEIPYMPSVKRKNMGKYINLDVLES
ncbi:MULTISPECIES: dethiobiotin synthase [Aliivibrio]|jgi:dethiobiotin synthetase|uniref:ATP-dependent dethiobiotin synthetase BioD n=1 Tax=Aliivibrio finisterrensis TaxID=511998 RepID=A0A4Q5KR43_9GAMM|nr:MULTISPECIES: dethiobiotin synthase [Aliivibrio]MDD9174092.1 dethiobiotin synthase [Aliivibrio sp. S3TY1]MDD9180103.1 dethiobiotin synthase [Aliivibrio sp. A6]MDD9191169.1 dethiobiotin synthase [Aliivibrio sp. S2TY2]RYU48129.1 ATP-dependent dethiobiotin synthetase BioD [Aliivibrio finisterrensis]RYU49713.1 ATP-dependent dethiobiotin synthetase BioD [Aliivibrio finisterrensis]